MSAHSENRALARLVMALGDFRSDVVFIGGWAHRLLRLHPLSKTAVDFEPLFSEDVDMVLPAKVVARDEDLGESLRLAGFKEHFVGEHRPPVTHYRLGEEGAFYAEFLTPLVGRPKSGTRRIAGVNVQELRYLDILMIAPWSVFLTEPEYPVGPKAVEIRVANGGSYLAQKLLAIEKRDPDDRGKDVLYIHDTLITLGASLPELRKIWSETIAPKVQEKVSGRLRGLVESLFSEVSDPVRRGSQIARDAGRPVSPEEIADVCRKGLAQVFGPART